MKSIFRKIAFVLALAMVVTMFPVMNASAANNGNKYARTKDATLYVGGDANGDYEGCWAAQTKTKTWMKEEGYKSSYKTSDDSVVTVSKYGYVEAVSVGKAEITATFSKKGEEDIVETFNVTVKKNAVSIALDKESQDALSAGLTAGDKVTLKAVQTDADGSNEGITDTVKFYCASKEDKEIIELNKDTGELTALKAGKATVVVQSCQYEYDRETKKYKTTVAAKAEYSVEVEAAGIVSAEQVDRNTVKITCGNAAAAKDLVDNKNKLSATYKLADQNVVAHINYGEVKVDSSNDKVVVVKLYDDLIKDYVYTFKYNEKTVEVTGADLTAIASIEIATTTVPVDEVREVEVKYYDAKHIQLPAGTGNMWFEVKGGDTEYFFMNGNTIYFTAVGKTAVLEATYVRGYKEDGTPDEVKSGSVRITSVDKSAESNQIDGWAIANKGDGTDKPAKDLTYSKDTLTIVKGDDAQLYGKYYVTPYGQNTVTHYTNDGYATFEYESTNDGIIMVDPAGKLYAVAVGSASIIVRRVYNETSKTVVGVCNINVVENRILTGFTAELKDGKNKMSLNMKSGESETITIVPKVNAQVNGAPVGVSYQVQVSRFVAGTTLMINKINVMLQNGNGTQLVPVTPDSDGKFVVTATGMKNETVTLSITASQIGTNRKITRGVTFRVKDVATETVNRYDLELGSTNIDMSVTALNGGEGFGKFESSIQLVGYDRDNFKVETKAMDANTTTPTTNDYSYTVTQPNGTPFNMTDNIFRAVTKPVSGGAVTGTGSAITNTNINKIATGIYAVKVFKKDGNLHTFKNIVVNDSSANSVTVNVKSTDHANLGNLKDKMTFYRGGKEITVKEVFVKEGNYSQIVNDRFYVTKVTVVEQITTGNNDIKQYTFEYDVNVGKTFYNN